MPLLRTCRSSAFDDGRPACHSEKSTPIHFPPMRYSNYQNDKFGIQYFIYHAVIDDSNPAQSPQFTFQQAATVGLLSQ